MAEWLVWNRKGASYQPIRLNILHTRLKRLLQKLREGGLNLADDVARDNRMSQVIEMVFVRAAVYMRPGPSALLRMRCEGTGQAMDVCRGRGDFGNQRRIFGKRVILLRKQRA